MERQVPPVARRSDTGAENFGDQPPQCSLHPLLGKRKSPPHDAVGKDLRRRGPSTSAAISARQA